MSQPIHIVMTPVRNEAWVLRAFLESTTRWANYIIIADQFSTDGSREIVAEYAQREQKKHTADNTQHYCKIILIDNPTQDFNEHERQTLLVNKAREVAQGRDCLLWGLDADEILAANFSKTEAWQKILSSEKGSVFAFKWAEICPSEKKMENYWLSPATSDYYPWLFHDDHKEPHGNYARNMHSMRIPYPIEEKLLFYVDDFRVLHLAYQNLYRVASKRRFYQFVDWEMNHRSPIVLSLSYSTLAKLKKRETHPITPDMLYTKQEHGFELSELVLTKVKKCYMDEYIVERLSRHDMRELRKLNIWQKEFLEEYNLKDPRRLVDKLVHRYLNMTALCTNNFFVRILNKILKTVY